jgi:hypothetical protein
MSTGSFEKTNFAWQLGQRLQQMGEWLELQTSRFQPTLPNASLPAWLNSPILWTIVNIIFWIVLALLLSWTVLQVMRRLSPYIYTLTNQLKDSTNQANTSEQNLSISRWLQQAQKFQQKGNYREACLCLYKAMLQQLNDNGFAPHQPSRTDGEYLQLVQQLPQPQPYQTLLITHQELCFSNTEASSAMFEQCQQAYQEIEAP